MVKVVFHQITRHRVRRTVLRYKAGKIYNIPRKIAEIMLNNGRAREVADVLPRPEVSPESPALSPTNVDEDVSG